MDVVNIFYHKEIYIFLVLIIILTLTSIINKKDISRRAKDLKDFAFKNGFKYFEKEDFRNFVIPINSKTNNIEDENLEKEILTILEDNDEDDKLDKEYKLYNIHKNFDFFEIISRFEIRNILAKDKFLYYEYYSLEKLNYKQFFCSAVQQKLKIDVPDFVLTNESLLYKIGKMFWLKNIDIKNNPNFSKKFLLRGKDQRKIENYFNIERLKFFENNSFEGIIEVKNNILLYNYNTVNVQDIDKFIISANKIIEALEK